MEGRVGAFGVSYVDCVNVCFAMFFVAVFGVEIVVLGVTGFIPIILVLLPRLPRAQDIAVVIRESERHHPITLIPI